MDVTLNIEQLLEKRTIFERDLSKKLMRRFLIDALFISALGVFLLILARMEIIELSDGAGGMYALAVLLMGAFCLHIRTEKLVRFYEDEIGLSDQRAKL